MVTDLLQELQKRLDELRAQRLEIDQAIDHYEGVLRDQLAIQAKQCPLAGLPEAESDADELPVGLVYSPGTFSHTALNLMMKFLVEHRELSRRELVQLIQAEGVVMGGRRPGDSISPYLNRDPRFIKSDPPGKWKLAPGVREQYLREKEAEDRNAVGSIADR